jgi:hypothetical protein
MIYLKSCFFCEVVVAAGLRISSCASTATVFFAPSHLVLRPNGGMQIFVKL